MDSLTQAILGAAVAEVTIGRKEGNKAIFWGAIIGTIPDLDVLIARFYDPIKSLLVHRGFSHSIVIILLLSPLIGYLLKRLYRKSTTSLKQWNLMVFLVLGTHVFLDLFTTYGTGLFEPFSNYRVEWSTIAIIDPFYTVPLLLSILLLMFFKRYSGTRRVISTTGLLVSTVYLMLTVVNKYHVTQKFRNQLAEQNIVFDKLKTVPLPLTNFLWMGIAGQSDGYFVGLYSLFDSADKINFSNVKRNEYLILNLMKNRRIKDMVRFSKGYYTVNFADGGLVFSDLRFGKLGFNEDSPYIFSFSIRHDGENLEIDQVKMPEKMPEGFFKTYCRRIFGDEEFNDNPCIIP